MRTTRVIATIIVTACVAAGCGTTVSDTGGLDTGGLDTSGLSASGVPGQGAPDAAGSRTVADGLATGAAPTDARAVRPDPSDGRGPTAPNAVAGRPGTPADAGMPAGPVQIGVHVADNTEQARHALGIPGGFGDNRAQATAVIRALNERGGLGGRRIEPVWASFDATSTNSWQSQEQQACTTWTQDNHVVAAVSPISLTAETFVACMAQHRTPLMTGGVSPYAEADFAAAPLMFNPRDIATGRTARAYARGLVRSGFFDNNSRLGTLLLDVPALVRSNEEDFKPTLAAEGITVHEEFTAQMPQSNQDIAVTASEMQSAVLRFRTAGVTHVTFFEYGAVALLFMLAAEDQGYRPRYGLTTRQAPELLRSTVPREQLLHSLGVGWNPQGDVTNHTHNPGLTKPGRRCKRIMTAAGLTIEGTALAYCELFFLLEAAMAAGDVWAPEAIAAAVTSLQNRYTPVTTHRAFFSATRHDGAADVRPFAYVDACSCFRYTGRSTRAD